MMRRVLPALLVAPLLGLTGCGSSSLTASQLQDEVKATLERTGSDGPAAVALHCDGGLVAEVGAERECTALAGNERVGLRVKATQADPLQLSVAPFLTSEELAEQIVHILTQEGHPVAHGSCAGPLAGRPHARATCQLWTEDRSRTHEVEATVAAVDGLMIDFKFEETE